MFMGVWIAGRRSFVFAGRRMLALLLFPPIDRLSRCKSIGRHYRIFLLPENTLNFLYYIGALTDRLTPYFRRVVLANAYSSPAALQFSKHFVWFLKYFTQS